MTNIILAISFGMALGPPKDRPCVLTVVGAAGEPEYQAQFHRWADQWQKAAEKASAESIQIGRSDSSGASDHDLLRKALADQATAGREAIWIILIGHGTHDGREAKFNLR